MLQFNKKLCETFEMTAGKEEKPKPDLIQKQIWHYRRVWVGVIAVLIAGRFLLPHFMLLKGWELKFSNAAIELGKSDIPGEALKGPNIDEALSLFHSKIKPPPKIAELNGPILVAAWRCLPQTDEGVCIRYLWKDEPITLIVSAKPRRARVVKGPFAKAGWGGYFVIQNELAAALVGPFTTPELEEIWGYAR